MNPADQERRARRQQLHRARWTIDQRQIPAEVGADAHPAHAERDWDDLVERRIQEAMAAGAFDRLPGQGKPLNLTRNPYLDPSLELAFGLLKNNGYTPEWISRDKQIRQELEAARLGLRAARARRQANPAHEADWQAAVARFEHILTELNAKIDDYNLVVPIPSCQRVRLRLTDELRRLDYE
jgi:DnaJ family protein C protein 28